MASARKSAAKMPFMTARPAAEVVVCSIFLSFLLCPAHPGACTHILRDDYQETPTSIGLSLQGISRTGFWFASSEAGSLQSQTQREMLPVQTLRAATRPGYERSTTT